MLELSVVVPCLNEEHNLDELTRRVLGTFDRGGVNGELVLVDDGSTDDSRAVIARLGAELGARVVGLRHGENRGISAAWETGVGAARGTLVAVMDADLQYQPEDLLRLLGAYHEGGADVIQGYRSAVGRERDSRYHLSRGFNFLLNETFDMALSDNKSGFLLCPREVMTDLLRHEGRYRYFQSFIAVAAHAKGYRIREIETLFLPRRAGQSFLDGKAVRVAAECVVDLARAAVEYRRRARPHEVPPRSNLRGTASAERPRAVPDSRRLAWKAYLSAFDATHYTIGRGVEAAYESLERTQWWSSSDLRALQDERLRDVVRHAYENVPFYRARFDAAGVHPRDIHGTRDLHRLPLLSKRDIRENVYAGLLARDHVKADMRRVTTSGSTGEPLAFYVDRAQLELRWASTLRSQGWTGYRFGDPSVRLWHQSLGLDRTQAAKERLDAALSRRTFVPVFELSEARLSEVLRRIAAASPALLDGYAEALHLLAAHAIRTGYAGVRPRAVMTSAQTLSAESRALVEAAFGCAVFDKYGAREFSGIAYECDAHEGHHVVSEAYVVEVLRDGEPASPGETGEVVVTDLTNLCMPFIRYRIGDLAIAVDDGVPCSCGRGLSRLGHVEGRVQSIIQGTLGRYLPGTFFAHYLKDFDHAIARYQITQDRPGHVVFRVVPGGRFSRGVVEEALRTFRKYLGEEMVIEVHEVPKIELRPSGKHLATVSSLPFDFQTAGAAGRGRRA